ncbi:MAG: DNA-binding domain-containing protein [Arenimonas sp.]|nr:DNA-binding domain-containing protein [Arenimonas sp.]
MHPSPTSFMPPAEPATEPSCLPAPTSAATAFQSGFAAAVTDLALPVPKGLAAWTGNRPTRRFGVYRNNVRMGLTGALATRFPATEAIVGPEFFSAMAEAFVAAHPPRSPLLLAYGDDFAGFVQGFVPAAGLAYLPDVIRLEAARSRAYHAADAKPLAAADLASVAPERLADLVLEPHPSLVLLRSAHPVVTLWAMNAGALPLAPITDWAGEDALIVRPHMAVEVHRLPPGGAAFFAALSTGQTLGEAAEAAFAQAPAFDLAASLAALITTGAFVQRAFREEA